MSGRLVLRAIIVLAFVVAKANAQEIPTRVKDQNRVGDLPFSTSVGTDIERVDLASGNLIVEVPILSLPGRGMDLDLKLRYNALYWLSTTRIDIFGNYRQEWKPEQRDAVALGWQENRASFTRGTQIVACNAGGSTTYYNHYIYNDPAGGKHPLAIQFSSGGTCGSQDWEGPDLTGEGMWGKLPNGAWYAPEVYLANGTRVLPISAGALGNRVWRDSNGNTKTEGSVWVDTLGRTVATVSTPTSTQRLYQVYDSAGTLRTYTVNLGTVGLATHFQASGDCSGVASVTEYTGSGTTITSIVLPNGRSYQFQYEAGSYGAITRIDLPTGGYITYQWATLAFGTKSRRYVSQRSVTANGQTSTWTFTPAASGFTVTGPDGNQSSFGSIGGVVTDAQFYQGTVATGTRMRAYHADIVIDTDPFNAEMDLSECVQEAQPVAPRVTRMTTTLDDGQVAKTEYDYETFTYPHHPYHNASQYNVVVTYTTSRGNVVETREHGYGAAVAGGLVRRSTRTFLHNATPAYKTYNIVSKPVGLTVYDGAGVKKAETQFEYDATARLSTTGVPGHDYAAYPASFAFRGNVSRQKRWKTATTYLVTVHNYDDLGNLRSLVDPLNRTTSFTYSDSWQGASCLPVANAQAFVTEATNALGHRFRISYYPCTGLRRSEQDENQILSGNSGKSFTYDLMGRIIQTDFPDTGRTTVGYAETPPVTITTTTKITSIVNRVATQILDDLGRISLRGTSNGSAGKDWTRTEYDAKGRVSRVSNPLTSSSTPAAAAFTAWTVYAYDALDRPTTVTYPDSLPTALQQTTFSYAGNSSTARDPAGVQHTNWIDALGRLTQVRENNPADGSLTTGYFDTTYSYDAMDNLTQVLQGGQTRTYTYDPLSRLTRETQPESGQIDYTYDDNGNILTRADTRPATATYTYDALNRLTGITWTPAGTPAVGYTYDAIGVNGKGRRTGMTDGEGSSTYRYDLMGRVTKIQRTNGTLATVTGDFSYNLAGGMTLASWPGQPLSITWTHDDAGRQKTGAWTIGGVGQNLVADYSFVFVASSATETATLSNGVIETATYNKRLQPEHRRGELGGIFWNLDYFYANASGKNNGNVIEIDDTSPGVTLKNQIFQYDYLNRLKQAQSPGVWTQTFTYDRWGNRLTQTGPGALTLAYSSATNRITTAGYNSYDAVGNQLAVPGKTFQYDSANRIKTVDGGATATYGYDGDGRRVRKTANGETRWYYHDPSGAVALEYKQGAAQPWDVRYFYFNGDLRVFKSETDGLLWVHSDHLGTPRAKTNLSGQVRKDGSGTEDRDWYYPYGQQINAPTDNYKRRFTGQERDSESGYDYLGARYLSGLQGRFSSPDPMPSSGSLRIPQSLNRYAYAGDNPIRFVDPLGLDYYDVNGKRIGATTDGRNYIVTNNDEVKRIKKSKTEIAVSTVTSAIGLPTTEVIAAMGDAVTRSNAPSGKDKEGGFHEEGGQYGLDSDGNQVAVAAAAGEYANPQKSGEATISTGTPADASQAGKIVTLQGIFHVHPKGEIVVDPKAAPGTVVFGGTRTTYFFVQPPSSKDLSNATTYPGNVSFVLGARNGRVYIYNGTGLLTPSGVPLKNFLKIGGE